MIPSGMSIQSLYRLYRNDCLLVNRKYQRKLCWTDKEKVALIDTILNGFPIPLILLAERPQLHGSGKYEILDGVQRLNAIFSFIENEFSINEKYFDTNEFLSAKLIAQNGIFKAASPEFPKLNAKQCASILDYQLAVTTFTAFNDEQITEIFGRINSSGRLLSNQERRQAGVVNRFGEFVRQLSAEIRGDASKEILLLSEMPEISIDSSRSLRSYGLTAEDIFWVKQGILWSIQLRESEDEEVIADLAASILLGQPFERSKEKLNELYKSDSELFEKIESSLMAYPSERLYNEMKQVFSVIKEIIEEYDHEANALRKIVAPNNRNPVKSSFYAIFMAFYDLLVRQGKSPSDKTKIIGALKGHQKEVKPASHYVRAETRKKNIDKTKGLIQEYFVYKEPSALKHGPGLAIDFENSVRRSRIETPRYEFKQGILELTSNFSINHNLLDRIINTICGIANLGPDSEGFIFIGVADKKEDVKRIKDLYKIDYIEISDRFVVGIDREAKKMDIKVEKYLDIIINHIRKSKLSDPLKTQVLTQIDFVTYKNYSVVRIKVPTQHQISYVGNEFYTREGNETIKIEGQRLLAVIELFQLSGKKTQYVTAELGSSNSILSK
jgi:uncharacterized protein with ParB-like and HNH nuclease domain